MVSELYGKLLRSALLPTAPAGVRLRRLGRGVGGGHPASGGAEGAPERRGSGAQPCCDEQTVSLFIKHKLDSNT